MPLRKFYLPLLSDTEKLWLFPRNRSGALPDQGLDVVDRGDGVGDKPGQTKHGGDDNDQGQDKQVKMIATPLFEP